MNATLLLLSAALGAGGDVVPAGWGEKAPIHSGGGYANCNAPAAAPVVSAPCCDPCASAERPRLLDRLKARFAGGPSFGCFAPAPPCDPCSAPAPSLLDKLRSRLARNSCTVTVGSAACPCGTSHSPAIAPVTPAPTPPANLPKDMPKDASKNPPANLPKEMPKVTPKETPKEAPKIPAVTPAPAKDLPKPPSGITPPATEGAKSEASGASTLPAIPEAVTLPPLPANPETPRISGSNSPY